MEDVLEQNQGVPADAAQSHIDFERRYNDLRPEFDRTRSELDRKERELQEARLKMLELQQNNQAQAEIKPSQDPLSEESWFNDEDKGIVNDFPEVSRYARKAAQFEVEKMKRKFESQLQERDDFTSKLQKDFDAVRLENQKMHKESYASARLGAGVYEQLENSQQFVDWVNQRKFRQIAMMKGDANDAIECMQEFMEAPEGQNFRASSSGQEPVERRQQQVQSVMGGRPASQPSSQNLNGEDLWKSIPDYE